MFSSVIVQTLVLHTIFVYLVGICNIIYKETWLSDSAHVFYIHLVNFKEWKHIIKNAFSIKYSAHIPILYHTQQNKSW